MKKNLFSLLILLFLSHLSFSQSISGPSEVCPLVTTRYTMESCSSIVNQWLFVGQPVGGAVIVAFTDSTVDIQLPDYDGGNAFVLRAVNSCSPLGWTHKEIKVKSIGPGKTTNFPILCGQTGGLRFEETYNLYASSFTPSATAGFIYNSSGVQPGPTPISKIAYANYTTNDGNNTGQVTFMVKSVCTNMPDIARVFNIVRTTNNSMTAPTWDSTSSTPLCPGESTTLFANSYPGATSYIWESNQPTMKINGLTPPVTTTIPSATVSEASNSYIATVSVKAVTSCGTTLPRSAQVIYGFEDFHIAGTDIVCTGDVVYYNVSPEGNKPGVSYSWIAGGGTIQTGQGSYKIRVRWGNSSAPTVVSCMISKPGCGSYMVDYPVFIEDCFAGDFMASPNPAKDNITVALIEPKAEGELSRQRKAINPAVLSEIVITDKLGNVVHQQKFTGELKQANIHVGHLKPDVYILQVRSGNLWKSKQIVIK